MNRDSFMALVEAFRVFNRVIKRTEQVIKRTEQAFLKSIEPDYIDLPEIMREAQQGIGGDYEQCKLN